MLNRLLVLILESPLGYLAFKVLDWQENRRLKQVLRENIGKKARTTQVTQKSLLYEGLLRIKRGFKETYTTDELTTGKVTNVDLHDYATADHAKYSETLAKLVVHHNYDIKTPIDKEKMIHGRMQDYQELQDHVIKRRLIREIRKESDPIKKAELQKQFEELAYEYAKKHNIQVLK